MDHEEESSLTPEKIQKLHDRGWVLKTDTLKAFREKLFLTPQAMAGEMGLTEDVYLRLENGQTRVRLLHLKAALNIVRIYSMEIEDLRRTKK